MRLALRDVSGWHPYKGACEFTFRPLVNLIASYSTATPGKESLASLSKTTDESEVQKFSDASNDWWGLEKNVSQKRMENTDAVGPLHLMNPCRVKYVCSKVSPKNTNGVEPPLKGLSVLDVGCGGGILSESLARLGANVTGLDASLPSIEAARKHAALSHTTEKIEYVHSSIEEFVASRDLDDEGEKFDVVCALEIIEHVNYPEIFLNECTKLLRQKNGHLFVSTLNRTALSYFLSIIMAEEVLQMVPSGTHDWSKYIHPDEMQNLLDSPEARKNGLMLRDVAGMQYNPVLKKWTLNNKDLSVNYIAHFSNVKE